MQRFTFFWILLMMNACTFKSPEVFQVVDPCEAAGIYPDARGQLDLMITAYGASFNGDTAKVSISVQVTNGFPETITAGEMRLALIPKTKWKILGTGPGIRFENREAIQRSVQNPKTQLKEQFPENRFSRPKEKCYISSTKI